MKNFHRIYFIVTIFIFSVGGILFKALPQKDFSENENRYLSTFPKLSLEDYMSGDFQEDIEAATADQFICRDFWTGMATNLRKAIGLRDSGDTYIGENGYYFAKTLNSDIKTARYKRNIGFVSIFMQDAVNSKFMLVPSPATVLHDELPDYAQIYDSDLMYMMAEISAGDGNFIDVRKDLQTAAKTGQVYFKTDHHWTLYGAYTGYENICKAYGLEIKDKSSFDVKKVSSDFYGTIYSKVLDDTAKPDNIYIAENTGELSIKCDGKNVKSLYDMSKLDTKDKYAVYFGGNYGRTDIINKSAASEKKLLIIKDSYANSMVPFLTGDYSQITMIDLRYYNESIQTLIKDENYDNTLILYEMSNFADDINLYKLTI